MANVDYVEVSGASSLNDVVSAVSDVLGAAVLDGPQPWMAPDDRTRVGVSPDPEDAGTVLVEIYYAGGLAARRRCAQSIFDALVARTRWGLLLTSDDAPGEGVVAERVRSAA
ncbi:hypothetical protein QM716_10320 [Rhodococcus sp. IEGM 1409]|uniref:hypothetical protein n=1 Tax=Rhodococcus sp. IEGM 1409 TaxID=3047082 RepID=UPI0024B846F0|nr:hypothetical protein [Rhodococcus sp. IEGM 1409]MDI9900249.1 hypothetical protein [Rhodococcus sp. IEGM 1409]